MGYKAVADLKVGHKEYIHRGESVSSGDVEDLDQLVADRSVVTDEEFAILFPETVLGSNQASGTPSNLDQIEGSHLQVNPPSIDEEDGGQAPGAEVPLVNPADVVPVDGASDPGSETSDEGQDDLDEDDQFGGTPE